MLDPLAPSARFSFFYLLFMPYKSPEARRQYAKDHYQKNKALYKERARTWSDRQAVLLRDFILKHLEAHHCVDCGERDPIVLEFDHREDERKSFPVGEAMNLSCSIETLRSEIAKCDVRCANCHRRKTAISRGWYRAIAA